MPREREIIFGKQDRENHLNVMLLTTLEPIEPMVNPTWMFSSSMTMIVILNDKRSTNCFGQNISLRPPHWQWSSQTTCSQTHPAQIICYPAAVQKISSTSMIKKMTVWGMMVRSDVCNSWCYCYGSQHQIHSISIIRGFQCIVSPSQQCSRLGPTQYNHVSTRFCLRTKPLKVSYVSSFISKRGLNHLNLMIYLHFPLQYFKLHKKIL